MTLPATDDQSSADDASGVLAELRRSQARVRREEALQIELATRFASFHEVDHWTQAASLVEREDEIPGAEGELLLGGDGCPWVSEFAVTEFAAATGRSLRSGRVFLAQAIELVHRLPRTWREVKAGRVEGWRARRVAEATMTLPRQAATWVDTHIHTRAQAVGVATLDRLVEEALARFDPERLIEEEQSDLAGRHVEVTVHSRAATSHIEAVLDTDDARALESVLSEVAEQLLASEGAVDTVAVRRARALGMLARGEVTVGDRKAATATVEPPQLRMVVRVTEGDTLATIHSLTGQRLGMVSIDRLQAWAGRSSVIVKPVLDLTTATTTTATTATATATATTATTATGRFAEGRLREQVIERDRTCVFPHCERPAEACDLDHIEAWPRGSTTTANLAPLCRHHHRVKTHTAWRYHRIDPGIYVWTSPHGLTFLVDRHGTHDPAQGRRAKPA
ncbi:MAG: HNH endonuclease signature motif containing protein [Nocardioides sp.]|uniref:HNH endonuclease signature motif containing protein n=1 Tax=Nocardioides sp. TaxID=35761 RepID=UPI0039E52187